jgi:ParB family chromosome partitioning protein
MPDRVRELCRLADISSKSLLIQVVRQSTPEKMILLIETLQKASPAPTRAEARRVLRAVPDRRAGRPKNFVFAYKAGGGKQAVKLSLAFKRGDVSKDDVLKTLRELTSEIQAKDPRTLGTRS